MWTIKAVVDVALHEGCCTMVNASLASGVRAGTYRMILSPFSEDESSNVSRNSPVRIHSTHVYKMPSPCWHISSSLRCRAEVNGNHECVAWIDKIFGAQSG